MIEPVVATESIERRGVDELCACQSSVAVVVYCGIWPRERHFRYITQIYGVVNISIDFISLVVEIIESAVIERTESQSEDCVDNRSCRVWAIAARWNRTRNRASYRAIITMRRRERFAPIAGARGSLPIVVPGAISVVETRMMVARPMIYATAWTSLIPGAKIAIVIAGAVAVAVVIAGAVAVELRRRARNLRISIW